MGRPLLDRPGHLAGGHVDWRSRADGSLLWMMLAVAVLLAMKAFVDTDLPGHLAYGLEHLRTGELPRTDPYSYTARGALWINHEWAFEWLIAVVYRAFGTWGIWLLQVLAWSGTGALVLRLALRQTGDARASALLFVSYLALSYGSISIRPQLVTYLAFAVLLTLMWESEKRPKLLVWAVPLMALWTNFHGGFLAGGGVLALYSLGLVFDARKGRADHDHATLAMFVTGCAAVATLVNPYGPELHRWLLWSLVEPNPHVTEWKPVGFGDERGVILAASVVLSAVAVWRSGFRRLAYLLPLAVTAVLSIQHARHMPFFSMMACAAVPLAVILPKRKTPTLTRKQYLRLQVLMAGIVVNVLALRLGFGLTLKIGEDPQIAWPTGAIQYVDSLVLADPTPKNALIPFDWAQLAIWRWYPHILVHYDGRHRTVYPLEIENEHWRFMGLEEGDWTTALTDSDLVIVRTGWKMDRTMSQTPGWGLAYSDSIAGVYLKGWHGTTVQGSPPESLSFDTRLGGSP